MPFTSSTFNGPHYEARARVRAEEVLRHFDVTQELLGAEVGVLYGGMSAMLLQLAPRLMLYMVDSFEVTPPGTMQKAEKNTAFAADRRLIYRLTSVEAAALFPREFDFVFLDADHSYEAVKADIAAWSPKIKPGGWLCGHDYGKPNLGVTQAVDELANVELGKDTTWFVRL